MEKGHACHHDDAEFEYDLFVIGGGSGGVRAAMRCADHGKHDPRFLQAAATMATSDT